MHISRKAQLLQKQPTDRICVWLFGLAMGTAALCLLPAFRCNPHASVHMPNYLGEFCGDGLQRANPYLYFPRAASLRYQSPLLVDLTSAVCVPSCPSAHEASHNRTIPAPQGPDGAFERSIVYASISIEGRYCLPLETAAARQVGTYLHLPQFRWSLSQMIANLCCEAPLILLSCFLTALLTISTLVALAAVFRPVARALCFFSACSLLSGGALLLADVFHEPSFGLATMGGTTARLLSSMACLAGGVVAVVRAVRVQRNVERSAEAVEAAADCVRNCKGLWVILTGYVANHTLLVVVGIRGLAHIVACSNGWMLMLTWAATWLAALGWALATLRFFTQILVANLVSLWYFSHTDNENGSVDVPQVFLLGGRNCVGTAAFAGAASLAAECMRTPFLMFLQFAPAASLTGRVRTALSGGAGASFSEAVIAQSALHGTGYLGSCVLVANEMRRALSPLGSLRGGALPSSWLLGPSLGAAVGIAVFASGHFRHAGTYQGSALGLAVTVAVVCGLTAAGCVRFFSQIAETLLACFLDERREPGTTLGAPPALSAAVAAREAEAALAEEGGRLDQTLLTYSAREVEMRRSEVMEVSVEEIPEPPMGANEDENNSPPVA